MQVPKKIFILKAYLLRIMACMTNSLIIIKMDREYEISGDIPQNSNYFTKGYENGVMGKKIFFSKKKLYLLSFQSEAGTSQIVKRMSKLNLRPVDEPFGALMTLFDQGKRNRLLGLLSKKPIIAITDDLPNYTNEEFCGQPSIYPWLIVANAEEKVYPRFATSEGSELGGACYYLAERRY